MTVAFFIELALKSVVVSAVTLVLLELLKGRSAAQRSWLAHAGLAMLLLLPAGALLLPSWRIRALTSSGGAVVGGAGSPGGAPSASTYPPSLPVIDWQLVLGGAYTVGAALLLLLTLVSIVRLFALQARSVVLVDANWLTALAQAQRRMGVKHGAALLVNDEIKSPISWGMLRPTILLNEKAIPFHADAEAIIAHELAHVVRLDWAKLLASRVAAALFWFNPFVWMLARQCHQLREEAADDAVLRSDVPSTDYAALLIGAAKHECKGALLAAHGVAPSRGSLKQRIARVLDDERTRIPAAATWAVACLMGALFLAGPLSAFTFQPERIPRSLAVSSLFEQPAAPLGLNAEAPMAGRTLRVVTPDKVDPGIDMPASEAAVRLASASGSRSEDGSSPPYDPLAPDFGDRIAGLVTGTADTRKLILPPEGDFAAAGYAGLHEREKTVLTAMDVTPAFMRDLSSVGYSDLSVADLVTLRRSGVSAEFIRKQQRPGERRLTPEELATLRER